MPAFAAARCVGPEPTFVIIRVFVARRGIQPKDFGLAEHSGPGAFPLNDKCLRSKRHILLPISLVKGSQIIKWIEAVQFSAHLHTRCNRLDRVEEFRSHYWEEGRVVALPVGGQIVDDDLPLFDHDHGSVVAIERKYYFCAIVEPELKQVTGTKIVH